MFDIGYECFAHQRNKTCRLYNSTRTRQYRERKARLTGEYLRVLAEAEQEEALRRVNESDKKPVPRKLSFPCRKSSRIKVESDESDRERLEDTDSDSDEEEASVVDQVPSASVHVKRTIDEELKMYANGELVVDEPVKRKAFDALLDSDSEEE